MLFTIYLIMRHSFFYRSFINSSVLSLYHETLDDLNIFTLRLEGWSLVVNQRVFFHYYLAFKWDIAYPSLLQMLQEMTQDLQVVLGHVQGIGIDSLLVLLALSGHAGMGSLLESSQAALH